MEITSSIRRVGNDIVAAYLIVTTEGLTLVDAGLPGMWSDLLAELRAVGRSIADVKGLILTHGDSDHIGFAERLRRDHGVPVYVHDADVARAKGGPKPSNAKQAIRIGPMLTFLAYSVRKGGLRTRWLTEVVPVSAGDTLDLPGAPQIIGLPGHSGGSIAVYLPAADAVFVGDGLTTRDVLTGATGPRPAPFTDEPDRAIASLRAIVGTGATWVLPGHGAPWGSGVQSAVEAVEAAHGAR